MQGDSSSVAATAVVRTLSEAVGPSPWQQRARKARVLGHCSCRGTPALVADWLKAWGTRPLEGGALLIRGCVITVACLCCRQCQLSSFCAGLDAGNSVHAYICMRFSVDVS